jgi:hypothetical protein
MPEEMILNQMLLMVYLKKKINKGLTTASKERLIDRIEDIEKKVKKISGKIAITDDRNYENNKKKDNVILEKKGVLLNNIENLKSKVITSSHYITDRIPANYPKVVRKVIQRIFEVIDRTLPEGQAQELQERIIEELISHKNN